MGKFNLLVCVVLFSFSFLKVSGQLDTFFDAFPFADKEALSHATREQVISEGEYVEPKPLLRACPPIPIPPDTDNINQLKPGHIRVVTAMGDSITAAMSAKDTNILLLKQYRGISYGAGGDPGVVTMPNLLQQYSPKGFPIGLSTGILNRPFDLNATNNGLNGAVSGAVSSDLLGQAKWVVNALKTHKVNMTHDWKLLTLWIGSNNLCQVCKNSTANDGNAWEKDVVASLDYLYANVPRLFINLLANLDVTKMYEIKNGSCSTLHPIECPCAGSSNVNDRKVVSQTVQDYIGRASKIAATFRARNNKSFAIVVQPFLIDSPIYDRTYLSVADCFHPSPIAHQAIATALWNSMLTPSAQKKLSWDPEETPLCATQSSFIHTD